MNTLPEILVKEHEDAIQTSDFHIPEFISGVEMEGEGYHKVLDENTIELANEASQITIAHIGKAIVWGGNEGYQLRLENPLISKEELVNKYFESLK